MKLLLLTGLILSGATAWAGPQEKIREHASRANAADEFVPPAPPPPLPDTALTPRDAARFLMQATFGPTKVEIDALTGKRRSDLEAWIDRQIAVPPSSHLAATDEEWRTYTGPMENPQYSAQNRQGAWWKLAVSAPDQLRQRVALALSEIFVVSDSHPILGRNPRALARYYDVLVDGAFGNFRDLLENVTLNPAMGMFLSSLRNSKATYDDKGRLQAAPDENFAREVMQLFTIGLNELRPDGTPKLDSRGLPIPTYDNTAVTELARVFTGWGYHSVSPNPNFRGEAPNFMAPMMLYPAFHDDGEKTIIGGTVLPAGQGGDRDFREALDALCNHSNTAPFICRQLIQRLVTASPSPAYVYRVARVFADNGHGGRGDLGAIVRAILLDSEARSPEVAATAKFGKLKEPLLRVSALLRAFDGGANNGRLNFFNPEATLGQAALRAPTVFNFFEPDYSPAGPLAAAGLTAPEYELLNDTTAISVPNQLWAFIFASRSGAAGNNADPNPAEQTVGLRIAPEVLALARTPKALIDHLNLLLAAGGLPPALSDRFISAISELPNSNGTAIAATDLERVRSAIYLIAVSPYGAVQR